MPAAWRAACLALLVAAGLAGCSDDDAKCGASKTETRDYTLADATAGFETRSWDVLLEDVCGREHHSAEFTMTVNWSDTDCDEDKVAVTGNAYTGAGLAPYPADVTVTEGEDDNRVDGRIPKIGYGQQADTAGAKTLLVSVEARYASDEGPEKADRCLMELVDHLHVEVHYALPAPAST